MKVVRFGDVPWEPRTEDDWPCLVKRQLVDEASDVTLRTVWYARGAVEPRHVHEGTHAAVVLLGTALVEGAVLGPWDVVYGAGGDPHGPLHYPHGCMLTTLLGGGAFHTAVESDHAAAPGMPSQFIAEQRCEWEPGEPQRKRIVADPDRGYALSLLRWPAGARPRVPDYAGASSTVVLSGRVRADERTLEPWDLIYARDGERPQLDAPEGCTVAWTVSGEVAAG